MFLGETNQTNVFSFAIKVFRFLRKIEKVIPKGILKSIVVCAWRDRRTLGKLVNQDRRDGVLEAAETANQQTVSKFTPKPINNVTKMKQNERNDIQLQSKFKFFKDVIFYAKRDAKARQTLVWDLVSLTNFQPTCITKGSQSLSKETMPISDGT